MKQAKIRNPKFFTRKITREGDTSNENVEKVTIVTNSHNTPDYAENVGYHLDPSRYDSLRKNNKDKNDYVENVVKSLEQEDQEVKVEKNNYTVQNEVSSYDYYGAMADEYVENDEPVIQDIITEDEMENDAPIVETLNEIKEETKPVEIDSKEDLTKTNKVEEEKEEVKVTPKKPVQEEIPSTPKKKKVHKKYVAPSLDLLNKGSNNNDSEVELAEKQKEVIDNILKEYNIHAHVAKYVFGPTVIVYFIEYESLNEDVKSIRKVEDNLSMYLEVKNIRMLTPIPGMRFAGIEVPRPKENRGTVYLGDMLSLKEFKNSKMQLPVAVGKTNFGDSVFIDINAMPHGLCAGGTGSGKSVCLNSFIVSLLYHYGPEDVRLILLDPKRVEFNKYKDIPHLAMPVIVDQEYFESTMIWLTDEMERRYQILDKYGCVKLKELNEMLVENHEDKLPYIVMIMDEFNDWFADASATVGLCMTKLTQKARAAGIHIILATQSPRADVIKGVIKANIPSRLAFSVTGATESIVILGQAGAEKLEGQGDMILRCAEYNDLRLQACFVSNNEIKKTVEFIRDNNDTDYIITTEELLQSSASRGDGNGVADPKVGRNDEYFEEVAHYVVVNQNASVNQLQKIFGTSFNRMDNIFRDLEAMGIVSGAQQGTKRKVLVNELELDDIIKKYL